MSDFAVENLVEIDDSTGVEGIEGRFARELLGSARAYRPAG